jgi:pimeloyl-ACP methyl ester carboxylesterase
MLELISFDENVNGIRLHYHRTGGDKPALVLIHGISDDGLCWTPVAEQLAAEYDIILVDMRGHGRSEAPEHGYLLKDLALDVAELIQKLNLAKPVLLGHSMGAITTLLLAGIFPDLPKAILLEDPPPFWMMKEVSAKDAEFRAGLVGWFEALKRKTYADILEDGRTSSPGWSMDELIPWVNSKHRFSPRIAQLVHPLDIVVIDFPKVLKNITCPALFISADNEKGAISSPVDIAKIQSLIPQLIVKHISNAGHSIRRDQFQEYMRVVRSQLGEIKSVSF